jgi:hypothetical protein
MARTGVGINVEEKLRISNFGLVGQLGIAIAVNRRDPGDGRIGRRILGDVDPVGGLGCQRDVEQKKQVLVID